MTRPTWPAYRPACYGTMCEKHGTCAAYHAVDGNSNHRQVFIGTCGPNHPLYEDTREAEKIGDMAAKSGQA